MVSKQLRLVLSLALVTVGLMASSLAAQAQQAPDGKALFEGWCGPCHWAQGQGQLAIPTIAGAAGHVREMGIPMDAGPAPLIELVREGIPGNMPSFPPEILSDEEILALGNHLFSLPLASGERLFLANCALCHGSKGQGYIGPPLYTTRDFLAQSSLTRDQAVPELKGLFKSGIPGRMPSIPQFTDEETGRLLDFLLALNPPARDAQWEAAFRATHGTAPSEKDWMDRQWSLEFAARHGRAPSDADWAARETVMRTVSMMPAGGPPGGPQGGPPPR